MRARDSITLLLSVLALGSCQTTEPTVVVVSVLAKDGIAASPTVELRVTLADEHGEENGLVSLGGNTPILYPTDFVIRADGRQGIASVRVQAISAESYVIGEGSVTLTIEPQATVQTSLELLPNDFQVNASYQSPQVFSEGGSYGAFGPAFGRQTASALDQSFVVVWENKSPAMDRLDVYYRLFDRQAQAKLFPDTGKSEERVANEAKNMITDMPGVAMQGDGRFVIVWQRENIDAPGDYEITSRAFLADGSPDPAANSGRETPLSILKQDTEAAAPHITTLHAEQGYVVVWQELETSQCQVMGRLLSPGGAPITEEPFTVATFACPPKAADSCLPSPVVAGGRTAESAFFVIWREQVEATRCTLNGAFFNKDGQEIARELISAADTERVLDAAIAATLDGYAVLWSATATSGTDTDGTCIRLRRYMGRAPKEQGFTLNTEIQGDQRYAALATSADGHLLAVWSSVAQSVTDPAGGIRARRLLPIGLPVGDELTINTTTTGLQDKPTIAPLSATSFFVAYEDNSGEPPDTFGSGIRGRIIYPDFDPQDGGLGALCSSSNPSSCGSLQLSCQSMGTDGQRCISTCTNANDPCKSGGSCKQLAEGPWVCF